MTGQDLRGIVFDKDGTLFDFNATWGRWTLGLLTEEAGGDDTLVEVLAAELGYDIANCTFLPGSAIVSHTTAEIADLMLPHLPPQPKSELVARLDGRTAHAPQLEATPLRPFLADLRARGFVLGIATNDSETPARAHLAASGIEDHFDFIAGADSGHGYKPGPGQLIAFSEAVGLAPDVVAMVGDSVHDLMAARAAGMRAVGVLTGLADTAELSPHADIVLPSIAGLPAWLASLTSPSD